MRKSLYEQLHHCSIEFVTDLQQHRQGLSCFDSILKPVVTYSTSAIATNITLGPETLHAKV